MTARRSGSLKQRLSQLENRARNQPCPLCYGIGAGPTGVIYMPAREGSEPLPEEMESHCRECGRPRGVVIYKPELEA